MNETTETIFTKTEAEYKKADKLLKLKRDLFTTLKAMEEANQYGTEEWSKTFTKYADTYNACHGYRPHWAR